MNQQKNSLTQHLYFAISSTTFSITHSLSPNTSIHFYFIPFQTNLHKHRWCAICTNKSSHFYQNNGYGYMNCIEWVELSESFSQLLSQSDSIWYFFPSSLIQFFIIIFQLIFICTYFLFFFIFWKWEKKEWIRRIFITLILLTRKIYQLFLNFYIYYFKK